MATIYGVPKEIVKPAPDYSNITAHFKREEEFVSKVKAWAKANGSGELAGEEIRFPVADGYARYIVMSLKPVKLIHLPTGDAYQFEYAKRLTAADVRDEVRRGKALAALFSKRA